MRKEPRSRIRNRHNQQLTSYTRLETLYSYAQSTSDWREWSFKMVSQRRMGILIAGNDVEQITRRTDDGTVQVVGYKATHPIRQRDESPCSLTVATMLVAAMRRNDPMDGAQTAEFEKFRMWPFVGDTRAVCVWPRPTAIEQSFRSTLLATGRLRPLRGV